MVVVAEVGISGGRIWLWWWKLVMVSELGCSDGRWQKLVVVLAGLVPGPPKGLACQQNSLTIYNWAATISFWVFPLDLAATHGWREGRSALVYFLSSYEMLLVTGWLTGDSGD